MGMGYTTAVKDATYTISIDLYNDRSVVYTLKSNEQNITKRTGSGDTTNNGLAAIYSINPVTRAMQITNAGSIPINSGSDGNSDDLRVVILRVIEDLKDMLTKAEIEARRVRGEPEPAEENK